MVIGSDRVCGPGRDPTGQELIHHKLDARQQLTTPIKSGLSSKTTNIMLHTPGWKEAKGPSDSERITLLAPNAGISMQVRVGR